MAEAVYILCFLTSLAVAWLLLRGYFRNGARLLLWSGLCFVGLSFNNAFLFLDRVVFPGTDLSLIRNLSALIGLAFLIYGLIWDTE